MVVQEEDQELQMEELVQVVQVTLQVHLQVKVIMVVLVAQVVLAGGSGGGGSSAVGANGGSRCF
jgi:hypothetical protein